MSPHSYTQQTRRTKYKNQTKLGADTCVSCSGIMCHTVNAFKVYDRLVLVCVPNSLSYMSQLSWSSGSAVVLIFNTIYCMILFPSFLCLFARNAQRWMHWKLCVVVVCVSRRRWVGLMQHNAHLKEIILLCRRINGNDEDRWKEKGTSVIFGGHFEL